LACWIALVSEASAGTQMPAARAVPIAQSASSEKPALRITSRIKRLRQHGPAELSPITAHSIKWL